MIRYDLRCKEGHVFDGWFRSSDGFEQMRAAGQVVCAQCGSGQVEKLLMAPSVSKDGAGRERPLAPKPGNEAEAALAKLRAHVEANSDYVGLRFADEARAMHEGRSEHRSIHGEARPAEARKLVEEGVPIAPLPFIPKRQTN